MEQELHEVYCQIQKLPDPVPLYLTLLQKKSYNGGNICQLKFDLIKNKATKGGGIFLGRPQFIIYILRSTIG